MQAQVAEVLADPADAREKKEQDERKTIFYELHDNKSLPPEEKSLHRLMHEGLLLVAAGRSGLYYSPLLSKVMLINISGSESTAKSLVITHYHLLANPHIMKKLRKELKTLSPTASWAELEQLPYLTGVITEGNRLSFGLTGRNCRVAPTETLRYGKYSIPPGTPVSTMSLFVNASTKYYPDPWTFDPERWIGEEAKERRKYMTSFGKGSRRCIGVNLAHMELYLAIAAVAQYDLELFDTDISDVEFHHEYMTLQPKLGSKGIRATVKGRAASNA